jgi:two-component system sensor histidine kinase/response regulator
MPENVTDAFDLEEALSIVDGDEGLFREIADVFIENYPADLSSIQDAIRRGDGAALRAAAHHLKGALAALAAGPARDTAAELEQMGRRADLSHAGRLCTCIEQQLRDLNAALKRRQKV